MVLAVDPRGSGEDQRLGATKAVRVVVVLYHHRDLVACHDVRFDPAVELPERWERHRPQSTLSNPLAHSEVTFHLGCHHR